VSGRPLLLNLDVSFTFVLVVFLSLVVAKLADLRTSHLTPHTSNIKHQTLNINRWLSVLSSSDNTAFHLSSFAFRLSLFAFHLSLFAFRLRLSILNSLCAFPNISSLISFLSEFCIINTIVSSSVQIWLVLNSFAFIRSHAAQTTKQLVFLLRSAYGRNPDPSESGLPPTSTSANGFV
jgi:hypothetical protein